MFQTLILMLPFLLAASALMLTIHHLKKPGQRKTVLVVLGFFAAFVAMDAVLLASLPGLGISYGPVVLPLVVLVVARLMLFNAWGFLFSLRRTPVENPRAIQMPFLLTQGLVLVLVIYAFMIEPHWLTVTQIQVTAPQGARITRPLRILHLTDLHVERWTHREQVVMEQAQALQPDLILLTGDYLNLSYLNDPTALRDAQVLLGSLQARYGVFAVNGTTEDTLQMSEMIARTPVRMLDDEMVRLELDEGVINLVGVTDWSFDHNQGALERLMASAPSDEYVVLLHHTPDLIETAAQTGVDLYLAGHTHGGQIRAPGYGAIVTFSRYGKLYEAGRYQVGPTTLYVSRGLGMEGQLAPRARFLSPPEIELITLVPPEAAP